MKITIVSYNDCGGAGIAALRLHKALMKNGINSSMLCIYKTTDTPKVYQFKRSLTSKVIEHLPIPYKQNKYKKYYKDLISNYECFSFPEAIYDITAHPLIKQADIINLHWVGNMLNYTHFFDTVKKPIVWTLHDMNPFLGISHYMGDRNNNLQFIEIEEKVRIFKYEAIKKHHNVSVVNLCNWMKSYSSQSDIFASRNSSIIPNSIDISIFKIYDKQEAKKLLNLPEDKPILMFVSQDVGNKRKGLDLLTETIKKINRECCLLVIGEKNTELVSNNNCIYTGKIKDEKQMAMLYSATDVFILPSREDNLPNVMLESLCCGTPIISFSNGGMKDYIQTMKNGILVEKTTSEDLLSAINLFLDNIDSFDSKEKISKESHKKFSPDLQANRYIEFYKSAMNKDW